MRQSPIAGWGRLARRLLSALAFALVATAAAADPAAELASTVCAPCHAADGNSVIPNFPKIAGQQPSYLAKQLADIASGKRKSDAMGPTLASVKSGDFAALAAWFGAQKQSPGKVEDAALAKAGEKLFKDGNEATGVPACVGCHMAGGGGNERNPRISGQHQAYAIKEMMDFKSGARANDKGRVMRVVAERLTEAEIKAVAEYMAGL
jgi:cytochrome c553